MGFTVEFEGEKYEVNTKKIEGLMEKMVPRQIQSRSRSGIDKDGKPFAKYSQSYANWIRSVEGNDKVDLERDKSSGMLAGISLVDVKQNGGDLTFVFDVKSEDAQKAQEHHDGKKGMPPRKFMGLTDQQRKTLANAISKLKIFSK